MKILVFDTETTGLPEKNSSIYEHDKWPHILQISYILYDSSTNDVSITDEYIKINDSVEITQESYQIHHLTREFLNEKGRHIIPVLNEFNKVLKRCDVVVGHNISFDKRIVYVECLRNKVTLNFTTFRGKNRINKPEYCTMKNTKELCNIIRKDKLDKPYLKNPKLTELYLTLFPEKNLPEDLHNSLVDILITLRCYIKINNKINITDINDKIKNLFLKYNCL